MLIAEALKGRPRESYVLSVKFGALRDPAMGFIGYDARPEAVKNFLTYSLKRLGVDHIDIYRPRASIPPCRSRRRSGRSRRWLAKAMSGRSGCRKPALRPFVGRPRCIRFAICRSNIR